jgi:poly-gamma-glutamate biosynthesis protein PgsC/CapC
VTELLPLSIGIGLAIGLLMTELFGISAGGLIVPGYFALFLTKPLAVLATLAAGLATFLAVKALSSFVIIYGRRRTALMILMGFLAGVGARALVVAPAGEAEVIGYIIPGLVAIWMDRQGIFETLGGVVISSVLVRLILVLAVGSEALP